MIFSPLRGMARMLKKLSLYYSAKHVRGRPDSLK